MEIGIFISVSDAAVRKIKGLFLTRLENEALGEFWLVWEKHVWQTQVEEMGGWDTKQKSKSSFAF